VFEQFLPVILASEGGYSNRREDRGGATNYGVTQAIYDDYRQRSVASITLEEVRDIYETRYWIPSGASGLASVSTRLALVLFDSSVNHGQTTAVTFLQRSLKGVQVDGKLGPNTMKAVALTIKDDTEPVVLDRYLGYRQQFYNDIVTRNPQQGVFAMGWMRRLDRLRKETGLA
jgi:lysozyme family protein